MPNIELTAEQVDELRMLLEDHITYLTSEMRQEDPVEELSLRGQREAWADILELLEIA